MNRLRHTTLQQTIEALPRLHVGVYLGPMFLATDMEERERWPPLEGIRPGTPKEGKEGIDICRSVQGRQAGNLATFAHAEVLDHVLVSCTMGVRYDSGQFDAQPGGFGQDRLGID